MSVGVKLINGGELVNSRLCQVQLGEKTTEYTPYEVEEYGFENGRIYVSKEIRLADSPQRVFLERLHKGETSLFYYRQKGVKTFFIQKDSNLLVEIPKRNAAGEDYSKQLLNLTNDCPDVSDASKLVSYKKDPLTKLITRYNDCELKPFPHFKFGLIIGYEFAKLVPSEKHIDGNDNIIRDRDNYLDQFDYKFDGDFSIGLFIDNPIFVSDFSVHAELLFSKHGYTYNYTSNAKDLDLKMNISSLSLPLLLRYTLPENKFRPYFNAGLRYAYLIKNDYSLYETSKTDNTIKPKSLIEGSILSKSEIGYAVGCGLEYDLDFKRAIFLEVRFSKLYGISKDYSNKNSMINISTGISF